MSDDDQVTKAAAAAADLLPLAREIFAIMPRMRNRGHVPPPNEASAFFLYAACKGVAHYLATEFPEALPPRMLAAADQLVPEIARELREFVLNNRGQVGN
jgi:hypothetical protein